MSDRESKNEKIDDLEKSITAKDAEQVKGGATAAPSTTTSGSPILVKTVNPRAIVPCI